MRARVDGVELRVPRLDGEFAARGHRVAGIDGEVQNHLLDLARVRNDLPHVIREHAHQVDVLADEAPQHLFHPRDDAIRLEHPRLQHLLAAKREELARERLRPARRRADLFDRLPFGVAVGEALLEQFGVAGDGGEHVVEIVGDAASELPDRFHLLGLAQLGLEPLALGDVDPGAHHLHGVPRGVVAHAALVQDPAVRAVLMPEAVLDGELPRGELFP